MSIRSTTALDSNRGERSKSSSVESMTTTSTQELRDELQAIYELTDETEYNNARAAFVKKLNANANENDSVYSSNFESLSESIQEIQFDSRDKLLKQYDEAITLSTNGDSVDTNLGVPATEKVHEKTHLLTIHELDSTKTGLVSDKVAASYLYSDDIRNFDIKLQNIDGAKKELEKNWVNELSITNIDIQNAGKRSKRKSSKKKSSKRSKKGKRSTKHKRRR